MGGGVNFALHPLRSQERDPVNIPHNIYKHKRAQNLACTCIRTRAAGNILPVARSDFISVLLLLQQLSVLFLTIVIVFFKELTDGGHRSCGILSITKL
jgi:hypothetical protein